MSAISQYFVRHRSIGFAALVLVLAWGAWSYTRMPQRQDPIIPVRTAVAATPYPGARPEKVEQEVTRKIERKVAENPAVEHVYSISRQGFSFVYIELFEQTKDANAVWMDLRQKLAEIPDLPRVGGQPMQSYLDTDFGDTVAVMLTISSPPVEEKELRLREKGIRESLEKLRAQVPPEHSTNRVTGVMVYPTTVPQEVMDRMGQRLARFLSEQGMGADVRMVQNSGAALMDFQLLKSKPELMAALKKYENEDLLLRDWHPDVWQGFLMEKSEDLYNLLQTHARDKYTYKELRQFSDRIRDVVKKYPTIAKVNAIGVQPEQVSLFYSGQRFEQYDLTPELLMKRLQARNTNLPGGTIDLPNQKVAVRPSGEFRNEAEIGNVVISVSSDGLPIYLRDVVDVVRGYADPPSTLNFQTIKKESEGRTLLQTGRAVTLAIRQVKGTQISQFGREVDAALADLAHELPPDLLVERTSNEPEEVHHKIGEFEHSLLEAIVIVVVCALLFMEWRSALLVAIAIPITVSMTMGVASLLGIDIQQVSIAALIIALGLLVDDPVVTADAINRELAGGVPSEKAAWMGPAKLAHALVFATITLCVAFLPLLLITGQTGDFIYTLPVIVAVSLICSRLSSMTFLPLVGYYILRGQKAFSVEPGAKLTGFPGFYYWFANGCIRHKFLALGVTCLLFCASIPLLKTIGTGFFPKDLHDVFTVNVFMAEGTPLNTTRDETQRIIQVIEKLAGSQIDSYTTFVGAGGPRFWLSVAPEMPADNYAQILVHNKEKLETAGIVNRLKLELPQQVSSARITVEQLESGPPIGIPVQVRIYGSEMPTLRRLASEVKRELLAIPGTSGIHDDWDPEVMQVSLNVDTDRASITGITNQDVALTMYTGLSGYAPTQLREDDQLIDISLRLRPDERAQISDLYNLSAISSLTNVRVPLRQMTEGRYEMIPPKVRRRDNSRCLTVKCDAAPGTLPSAVVEKLKTRLPSIDLPPGYRFEFGGEDIEQTKGFASVQVALIVSLIAIYIALVLQFQGLVKPLLVFAAVPFGMVAGMLGLKMFGASFGFMAFLGIASLAGVIVSHVIVLFDFIEEAHHHGVPLRRAVVEAGLARLRPVLVTVLAAAGGLTPLALHGGPLWEPMCYVQIVGLLAATVVTLVLVPVLYVIFVESLRLIEWKTPSNGHGAGNVAIPEAVPNAVHN